MCTLYSFFPKVATHYNCNFLVTWILAFWMSKFYCRMTFLTCFRSWMDLYLNYRCFSTCFQRIEVNLIYLWYYALAGTCNYECIQLIFMDIISGHTCTCNVLLHHRMQLLLDQGKNSIWLKIVDELQADWYFCNCTILICNPFLLKMCNCNGF